MRSTRDNQAVRRRGRPARAAQAPARTALALALALALPGSAESTPARPTGPDLTRAWSDPRTHAARPQDRAGSESLARQYGLEHFLLERAPRATRVVTHCGDSGAGSLRDTIAAAQTGDLVDLRELSCSTITVGSGEIVVPQADLSIVGAGTGRITINSKYTNRIFNHTGEGILGLQGVTIANGASTGVPGAPNASGGCIRSNGMVVLGNPLFVGLPGLGARVENCRAEALANEYGLSSGGGIRADAVVLVNSRVSGNQNISSPGTSPFAVDGGGGIACRSLSMLFSELSDNQDVESKYGGGGAAIYLADGQAAGTITNSTIVGNSARIGGGLSLAAPAAVRNSTISGNVADEAGGGIFVGGLGAGDDFVSNSTITGNVVAGDGFGGGVYAAVQPDLHSTIVHGNFRFGTVPDDVAGKAGVTGASNLVGISSAPLPPGTLTGVDPLLGPLANHGGRTRTHALLPGSPAISLGGNAAGLATDQRGPGFPRVVGAHPDIGAYEFDPDRIFTNGFQ
jgi:hypothetical protein